MYTKYENQLQATQRRTYPGIFTMLHLSHGRWMVRLHAIVNWLPACCSALDRILRPALRRTDAERSKEDGHHQPNAPPHDIDLAKPTDTVDGVEHERWMLLPFCVVTPSYRAVSKLAPYGKESALRLRGLKPSAQAHLEPCSRIKEVANVSLCCILLDMVHGLAREGLGWLAAHHRSNRTGAERVCESWCHLRGPRK